jgi:quinohemoprotein ethanol dehydrogenase
MRFVRSGVFGFLCAFSVAAGAATTIDNAALTTGTDGHNWAAYGRTFDESHYSPLTEINRETVPRLNLAWTLDLDVTNNLSTPLAVEGVIYVASGYSFVHAVDAKTGHLLWRYDPEVAKVAGEKLRNGWGIRGLAFWKGRLFVGTHDGTFDYAIPRRPIKKVIRGLPAFTTVRGGAYFFLPGIAALRYLAGLEGR